MNPDRHLRAIDLDVLALQDPATAEQRHGDWRTHLARCQACRDHDRVRSERRAAFTRAGLLRVLARLPREAWRRRAGGVLRARPVWLAVPVLGLGLVLALGLLVRGDHPGGPGAVTPGVKGDVPLRVFARRGQDVFELSDGATVATGDALRFVLQPAPARYLLIASIDGAGKANVYFPYGGEESAPVAPGTTIEAPSGSIVLDRAPGPERVFALWSTQPLSSAVVRARLAAVGRGGAGAIRGTTALGLPGTVEASLLFEKEVERP